ncbi:MAG: hypothetical protein ACREDO_13275 [Methyloceanibacter sp.]
MRKVGFGRRNYQGWALLTCGAFDEGEVTGTNVRREWTEAAMPGKRVQFDDETWAAIEAVADDTRMSFQELADEAFKDFLESTGSPSASRPL